MFSLLVCKSEQLLLFSGVIATGTDLVQIFISPVLSYYMSRGHRPRCVAIGMYIAVVSTVLMSMPHFIYGPGDQIFELTKEYAAGQVSFGNMTHDTFVGMYY